jgi:hypothetical protein
MAYEWCYGTLPLRSGSLADQTVSGELSSAYGDHLASLKLTAKGYGRLTARNLDEYLVRTHLEPSATKYLAALSDTDRETYLAANTFITWADGKACFSWAGFLTHQGTRSKDVPAFDAFDLSTPETNLFGTGTTAARHFTLFSLQHEEGDSARLDEDIPAKLNMMNPMYHLVEDVNEKRSRHWWIRDGALDSATSLSVVGNLHARLKNLGDDVSTSYYWDAGHGADEDPGDFIAWIARMSGRKGSVSK